MHMESGMYSAACASMCVYVFALYCFIINGMCWLEAGCGCTPALSVAVDSSGEDRAEEIRGSARPGGGQPGTSNSISLETIQSLSCCIVLAPTMVSLLLFTSVPKMYLRQILCPPSDCISKV